MNDGAEFAADLRHAFRWRGDRTDAARFADPTGWWAEPRVLRRLGPALTDLLDDLDVTVIIGPQSRGALLGALAAAHLGVGLVEVHKDPSSAADSDRWLVTRTPPDYRDRKLRVGLSRAYLGSGHRALFVDDWIDAGGQAVAARDLVERAGAACATAVSATSSPCDHCCISASSDPHRCLLRSSQRNAKNPQTGGR